MKKKILNFLVVWGGDLPEYQKQEFADALYDIIEDVCADMDAERTRREIREYLKQL